jgi:hypothetical protein
LTNRIIFPIIEQKANTLRKGIETMTIETTPAQTDTTEPARIFLSDEPARLAAYINHRKSMAKDAEKDGVQPYNFADFVTEMHMTDFNDIYQIRATLESQAQLLGTAFQYLMLDGDWKELRHILRAQKIMCDTISLLNTYPPLTPLTIPNAVYEKNMSKQNAPMD